jgi:AbrB family looped-hinge helix DNA binding protein
MDVAITKMSSKGQVVIPADMRKDIAEGDNLVIIRSHDQIIMKQADKLDKNFAEDIAFAKKTEDAWTRIKEGKGIKMDFDEFIEEMKKW